MSFVVFVRRVLFPVAAVLGCTAFNAVSLAEDAHRWFSAPGLKDWLNGRFEWVSGADATSNSLSGYGGVIIALEDPVKSEGYRLRLWGSHGTYRYVASMATDEGKLHITHTGNKTAADAMLGYQANWGSLWLKTYLGAAYEEHLLSPPDALNENKGGQAGAKGLAEAWLNLGERSWLAGDVSYSTVNNGYAASLRLGHRATEFITLGPEIAAFGDDAYDAARAGGFLKLHLKNTGITFAGGFSGDYGEASGYYGSISLYRKF